MGYLSDKFRQFLSEIKNAAHGKDELKTAIQNHDIEAVRTVIAGLYPASLAYEDTTIEVIRQYGKTENADPAFYRALCEAVYNTFDSKIQAYASKDKRAAAAEKTGYAHPRHIYSMAAYMNDVDKLKELNAKGITPDQASDRGACNENIIMGTATLGCYEAMKEVIRQGASIDKAFGWDDFPPIHAFAKPLFHAMRPGVTEALLETGDKRIIEAVKEAVGSNYKSSTKPKAPDMHP